MEKKYWFIPLFAIALLVVGAFTATARISTSGGNTVFTYTIANAKALDLAEAFVDSYDGAYINHLQTYGEEECQEETFDRATCESNQRKGEFVDKQIKKYASEIYGAWKIRIAEDAARAGADTSITID